MSEAAENALAQKLNQPDWKGIASSHEFKNLISIKKAFIVPAFLFFLVHYLALAVLVGYAPELAAVRVIGTVTVAYLFALSQFAVGWIIAGFYLLIATKFDAITNDILTQLGEPQGRQ